MKTFKELMIEETVLEKSSVPLGRALDNIQGMMKDKSLDKYITNLVQQIARNLDKMDKDKVDAKLIKSILKKSDLKKHIQKFEDEVGDFKDSEDEIIGYILEAADKNEKGDKKEYEAFFKKMLKKYGVTEPDQLSKEDKKKFFDEVDKKWKADKETD